MILLHLIGNFNHSNFKSDIFNLHWNRIHIGARRNMSKSTDCFVDESFLSTNSSQTEGLHLCLLAAMHADSSLSCHHDVTKDGSGRCPHVTSHNWAWKNTAHDLCQSLKKQNMGATHLKLFLGKIPQP